MEVQYKKATEISKEMASSMFNLMSRYYSNLSWDQFMVDLQGKDDVILMSEKEVVRGFTTIEHMHLEVGGESVIGIFSGNTIMDLSIPPSLHLQQGFIKYIDRLKKTCEKPLYWFLICKGYKTYRYLNVYFKDYYPNHKSKTPEKEQAIIHTYANRKYALHYNPEKGIIKHHSSMDYLNEDVAPITERILRKPEVAYFVRRNPGHVQGDELVCLASFDDDNLKSGYFRALR